MQYLIDDVLLIIFIQCDIDTIQHFISVNRFIYSYFKKQWHDKLLYDKLPIVHSSYNKIKEYHLLMTSSNLANEIIQLNKNPLMWRANTIEITLTRKTNMPLLSESLHQQLMVFEPPYVEHNYLLSETVYIKWKKNHYTIKYVISHYNDATEYLRLKETIDELTVKHILIKIIFDGKMYDNYKDYYRFSSYYFNDIIITDDHDTSFLVFSDYLQIDKTRHIYEHLC